MEAVVFSRAADLLRPIPDVVATYFPWLEEHTPHLVTLYRVYADTKGHQYRLNYDDRLPLRDKLLCLESPTRLRLAHHYHALHVDEYQDLTHVQAMIVELLVPDQQHVMAVGDDAHAIFGFRGSRIDRMNGFLKSFPHARIFRLKQTYRRTKPILNVAYYMLEDAKGLIPKKRVTSKETGSQPALVTCESELAQSQFLASRIPELLHQGVSIQDTAVLFRSSSHSIEVEARLTKPRLHFVKYGGLELRETAHVKDLPASLPVADSPLDAEAWHRVLLLFDRVGAKLAQRLIESRKEHPHPLDVLEQAQGKQQRALRNLAAVSRSVQDEGIPLMDCMNLIRHHHEPLFWCADGTEAEHRMDDLKKLVELAGHTPSLEVFLQDIRLDPNQSKDGSQDPKDLHLTPSPLHSTKGRERKPVLGIRLLDGQRPPVRSGHDEPVLEEERRLLCVAATRATDQLTMLSLIEHDHQGTQQVLTQPCRFIRSIPRPRLTALHAGEIR
jgi:DNA helicase-2/ATP-dependent DNA helicase PcrA